MKTQLVPVDPTEKMKKAADDQCFYCDSCKEATANPLMVWSAMIASAPTPPAQSHHELDDADIRAIALDCGFKLKPQPDGLEDLNPYVYKFARELLATVPSAESVLALRERLTPPAQEDEPVAEVGEDYVFLLRKQDNGDRWPAGTKLYTRPDSSGLRKAAEELISFLGQLNPNMGNWLNENNYMRLTHNLRSELNRGEA